MKMKKLICFILCLSICLAACLSACAEQADERELRLAAYRERLKRCISAPLPDGERPISARRRARRRKTALPCAMWMAMARRS